MSVKRENRMRLVLGLDPLPQPVEVLPCPDCGNVHTGRCNGKQVVEVVTLAPGETVHRPAQPRKRRTPRHFWRPCLPVEYRSRASAAGVDVAAITLDAIESAEAKHAAPPVTPQDGQHGNQPARKLDGGAALKQN